MATDRKCEFAQVGFPKLEAAEEIPVIPPSVFEARIAQLLDRIDADWIVVYGDCEHPANILRLTGFDPRFEEALLVLGRKGRALILGTEGIGHARGLTIPVDLIEVPSFALPWINRGRGLPAVADGLAKAGIRKGDRIGFVGWKPLEPFEWTEPVSAIAAPAFIVDALRGLVGNAEFVRDATPVVMHAGTGVRYRLDADQIALFDWGASRASLCSANVIRAARPGMSEPQAMGHAGYRGEQTTYRPILTSGPYVRQGLKSPLTRDLELGDAMFVTWGFWGGNCGRGGILAVDENDLRAESRGFIERTAIPDFRVLAGWYENLGLGKIGGELHQAAAAACVANGFELLLNTSHIQDWEDWPTTIFRDGDTTPVTSGLNIAADIFSTHNGVAGTCHCEDTLVIADADLRAELRQKHPGVWQRMQARRAFMRENLGIDLSEEVLPYSVIPAYLAPFWLAPEFSVRVNQ